MSDTTEQKSEKARKPRRSFMDDDAVFICSYAAFTLIVGSTGFWWWDIIGRGWQNGLSLFGFFLAIVAFLLSGRS